MKREHSHALALREALSKMSWEWVRGRERTLNPNDRHPFSREVVAKTEPVFTIFVPEFFCITGNVAMRSSRQKYAEIKAACERFIDYQLPVNFKPMSGRPLVLMSRHSSKEPDVTSDWPKIPLDSLLVKRTCDAGKCGTRVSGGVGLLEDDSNSAIDFYHWWQKGPRGDGFVRIGIYETGTNYVLWR